MKYKSDNNISYKPRVLLITKQIDISPTGGRELLCKLNYEALREIYGERLVLFELPRRPLQGILTILNAFKGHIDGLDGYITASALLIIQREKIDMVFVDGSNLGGFVKAVKVMLPNIAVSTFFHNVEARFFLGLLCEKKNLRTVAVLMVNYLAERKSVKYSDKIICMSQRDSLVLQKVYGRQATHVSPMALRDKMQSDFHHRTKPPLEKFALFVGGVFYANHAGITWFVQHVVPRIDIKICIVGRGFEAYRAELEIEGKVQVVGSVGELADWYLNAHFVIAPIFDGSGMKTKVAEALMYGKKIIGTQEAFTGYEDVINLVGWCCDSADDFVFAISCAQSEVTKAFCPQLRALYEEKYSFPAAVSRLATILSSESLRSQADKTY